jgi:predicted polyphosphate/ATP-dependent NAD kinase
VRRKVGLIVNPIAGMGGRVGLKGTDGWSVVEKALRLGARPWSQERAARALAKMLPLRGEVEILAYPGSMGGEVASRHGFRVRVIGAPSSSRTGPDDTRRAVRRMLELGADPIIFVGGDGTARDIYDAIGLDGVVVAVPAGVKMYSAVFASSPEAAGVLAARYIKGEVRTAVEREVMDIDEEMYRRGKLVARLYGYLRVPLDEGRLVGGKSPTPLSERHSQEAIAAEIIEGMSDRYYYIIGPGTTTKKILEKLGCDYSLLGVDVVRGGRLVGKDLNEHQILEVIGDGEARIIASPIGGQGYIFGRGNQQISPRVIRRAGGKPSIIVVATPRKMISLRGRPLLIDTNDPRLDEELSGWYRVIIGYRERLMYRAVPG